MKYSLLRLFFPALAVAASALAPVACGNGDAHQAGRAVGPQIAPRP